MICSAVLGTVLMLSACVVSGAAGAELFLCLVAMAQGRAAFLIFSVGLFWVGLDGNGWRALMGTWY